MIIRCGATTYSVAGHDELLQQWDTLPPEAEPLQLDLTPVNFIDPYGMCGLVLFLHHLPDEVCPVRLLLSGWPQTVPGGGSGPVTYLTRMGFWEAVGDRVDYSTAPAPERPTWSVDRNVLLEISFLRHHEAISEMLHKTGELLRNLSYTAPARGHILEVLSELCSNVILHAQAPLGAVAAMQTYRTKTGARYIVISIGDAGIGVRRSLAANLKLANRLQSDVLALSIAVQPGASRFAIGGHGGGLPRVLDIAKRYSGQVAFRSGNGGLMYNGKDNQRRTFEAPMLQGTQLRISLPEATMRNEAQGDLLTLEVAGSDDD